MNFTARHIVAPLALAASLIGAGSAHAAPAITTGSADEGTTLSVPVTAKCQGAPRCGFTITTVDGTATAGTDYTPATIKGTAKKQKSFARTLLVPILDDATDEDAETFTVRVTVSKGANVQTFDATQTVTASDLEVPQAGGGGKTIPSEFPADSGEPSERTTALLDGFMTTCETPFWKGVAGQFGAWGSFNSGCTVTIQCPYRVKGCAIMPVGGIASEKKVGQKTTMNSRILVWDSAGKLVHREDLSCAGTDGCSNTHLTDMESSAKAQFNCNGVRATGPLQDRAKISCGIRVQFTD